MKSKHLPFLLLLVNFQVEAPAHAKDTQGRIGIGYNAEFSNFAAPNGVPGVSLKYALNRELGTELVFGASTSTPGNSVAALKGFKNLFYETNLNFYFTLGAGLVSASSKTGVEFLTGFGAEAFIPGVESLGFSMETGVSFTNLSGTFVLKTLGVSFLNAGIHFYF